MVDPEGSRRLTAIFAADVAGYSRLMQVDDRATVATLEAYRGIFREHIEAHEGRVVDMTGDSILAVFDSPTEAVKAAFDVQDVLAGRNDALPEEQRMRFRIGVNLGEVISKADGTVYGDGVNIAARLESLGEPGGVTISGTVFDQVKNRIPVDFDFIGEQEVKNIADPIRAYRAQSSGGQPHPPKATMSFARRHAPVASVIILVLAASTFAFWSYYHRQEVTAKTSVAAAAPLQIPDRPSIAVLPFVNMSEDPKQEYFSDGMTEDVITSLSKLSGLFVIARNSVFTYKGRAVKPEQVSMELGVRYVLEGSVRKSENRVRITAQLIDATNGFHLWAEHYDGELKDIFTLQDSVTQKIVAALSPKLTAGEQSLKVRRETNNIEAYDLVLRGIALLGQVRQESNTRARQMFEQAIVLDPKYAKAYARVAWTYHMEWLFGWTEGTVSLDRALEAAKKAVAVDDSSAEAHLTYGWNQMHKDQQDLGVVQLEKAAALDPNFSEAYAHLSQALIFVGRPDEAIGFAKKAMRLDPHYAPWVVWFLGNGYLALRRYDDAIAAYQESLRRNPNSAYAHQTLAATYAEMGRDKEAKAEAAELLRLQPGFTVEWTRAKWPFKNQVDLDRYTAALHKAGLK